MEFFKRIFLAFIFFIFSQTAGLTIEQKDVVRVGISSQNFSVYAHSEANFICTGDILITDLNNNLSYPPDTAIKIQANNGFLNVFADTKQVIKNSKGPLVLTSNTQIGISDLNRKGKPAFYDGQFEIRMLDNGKFNIINILSMQNYLKGVVPNEMPSTFQLEALKAQAVSARNYANRDINKNPNYDVVDSHMSQVYYGYNSQRELTNKAVDQTLGLYALWHGAPVIALYFSTSCGITDSWENVFAQNADPTLPKVLPYLVSVWDNPDYKELKTEKEIEDFLTSTPQTHDNLSPKYRWEVVFTKEELEGILPKTLKAQSSGGLVEPKFLDDTVFGTLEDIKVLKRGPSGKALLMEIKTDKGRWVVRKELGIRRVLAKDNKVLNSANFIIKKENETKISEFIFRNSDKPSITYTLIGGGFGHGVGMSQYGANYMAQNGEDYVSILKHYYKGITVGTIPKKVEYNPYGRDYVIDFYYNKKDGENYYLKVDNTKRLANLNFYVNDIEFSPSLGPFSAPILMFDVTNYLKQGENRVIIKPISESEKYKSTRVWVEIGN